MDDKTINQLVEKYFEGETSLQEERDLQTYFRRGKVHESLLPYQPFFQVLEQEKTRGLDAAFETRLLQQLQPTEQPRLRVTHLRTWMARAAAVLLLVAGAWWATTQWQKPAVEPVAQTIDWSKYEPETPEEAYKILKASLHKASDELNDGASKAASEVRKVKKMNEVFN